MVSFISKLGVHMSSYEFLAQTWCGGAQPPVCSTIQRPTAPLRSFFYLLVLPAAFNKQESTVLGKIEELWNDRTVWKKQLNQLRASCCSPAKAILLRLQALQDQRTPCRGFAAKKGINAYHRGRGARDSCRRHRQTLYCLTRNKHRKRKSRLWRSYLRVLDYL